ncbi:hypothetical protein PYCCODRAFT_81103 [Trametes coccinea BRFM310]|uniref:Uncharacterized protein n=1 Tax=Trametes coccinea (strain BRFM310) TaxID=1353009 RepID=A0A1Y2IUT3_TRAC3|nr:hypothetical protein PYCCODRAFT_81103 [Trametes coccinea BRFM310]
MLRSAAMGCWDLTWQCQWDLRPPVPRSCSVTLHSRPFCLSPPLRLPWCLKQAPVPRQVCNLSYSTCAFEPLRQALSDDTGFDRYGGEPAKILRFSVTGGMVGALVKLYLGNKEELLLSPYPHPIPLCQRYICCTTDSRRVASRIPPFDKPC